MVRASKKPTNPLLHQQPEDPLVTRIKAEERYEKKLEEGLRHRLEQQRAGLATSKK